MLLYRASKVNNVPQKVYKTCVFYNSVYKINVCKVPKLIKAKVQSFLVKYIENIRILLAIAENQMSQTTEIQSIVQELC